MLAIDSRALVPSHLGAVLILEPESGESVADLTGLLAQRVTAVPRLGQRLKRLPLGCGRPLWVDDPDYLPAKHIERQACPDPADRRAVLNLATAICAEKLRPDRPLWRAVFITGGGDGHTALVLVLHHVLADGIGGLAVLRSILDPGVAPVVPGPSPVGSLALAREALATNFAGISGVPAAICDLRYAFKSAGGLHPIRAADCSLLRRTGHRRQIGTVEISLDRMQAAAHKAGVTINDVLLWSVADCLAATLAARAEQLDEVVIAVPASPRRTVTAAELGNDNAPLVVGVAVAGVQAERLSRISATMRAARSTSPGSSPAALLGPAFRVVARLGGYRAYLRRQHRFHTILSNVRGPRSQQTFGGLRVQSIIPVSIADLGNVVVSFVALSYAGRMTISIISDPDHPLDLGRMATSLRAQLDAFVPACDRGREAGTGGDAEA